MKRSNLANKLLAWLSIICLVVVCLAGCTPTATSPVSPVTVVSGTIQRPTYYFDHANGSILADLGVKDYNEYLYQMSQEYDLPEVVIAVLDSGINASHPVFAGRVLSEYARNFKFDERTKQVTTDDDWDQDNSGHGSHVAGLIADSTLSNVKILPIKIFQNNGDETISGKVVEDAIAYVAKLKREQNLNIVAMNMSLGTSIMKPDSTYYWNLSSYQEYINTLRNAGILPIVAAGNEGKKQREYINEGQGTAWYSLPAACNGAVAVSAYDTEKTPDNPTGHGLAIFSNFGDHISLSAPGLNILSAWKDNSDESYGYLTAHRESGTSMATPFVTLCYAMLMSDVTKTTAADWGIDWNASEKNKPFYYLNVQHKALLLHATDFGNTGIDIVYGYGGVNVADFACPADQVPEKRSYEADEVLHPKWAELPSSNTSTPTEVFANIENVFWVLAGLMALAVVISAFRYRRQRAPHLNEGEPSDEQ